MASLVGKDINNTYQGLVKSLDNNAIAAKTKLTDGAGNILSIKIGTETGLQGLDVCGTLNTTANAVVGTSLNVGGVTTLSDEVNVAGNLVANSNALITGNLTANSFNLNGTGVFSGPVTMYQPLSVVSNTIIGNGNTIGTSTAALSVHGNSTITGDLSVIGDIIAFYDEYSDIRLKDNLKPIDSKIYFDNLQAYTFDWNEKSEKDGEGKGFIAQEVAKIDESLVSDRKEYLKVDYISFIPILFAEIQKLRKEVDELKNAQSF